MSASSLACNDDPDPLSNFEMTNQPIFNSSTIISHSTIERYKSSCTTIKVFEGELSSWRGWRLAFGESEDEEFETSSLCQPA